MSSDDDGGSVFRRMQNYWCKRSEEIEIELASLHEIKTSILSITLTLSLSVYWHVKFHSIRRSHVSISLDTSNVVSLIAINDLSSSRAILTQRVQECVEFALVRDFFLQKIAQIECLMNGLKSGKCLFAKLMFIRGVGCANGLHQHYHSDVFFTSARPSLSPRASAILCHWKRAENLDAAQFVVEFIEWCNTPSQVG